MAATEWQAQGLSGAAAGVSVGVGGLLPIPMPLALPASPGGATKHMPAATVAVLAARGLFAPGVASHAVGPVVVAEASSGSCHQPDKQ